MEAIKRYGAADREWDRLVPESLSHVERRLLCDYLAFANRPAGVNGIEVQDELGIDQNRQSRLTQKLLAAGWLVRISRNDSDKRSHFVKTCPWAMDKKSELESALRTTMRPVAAPKTAVQAPGSKTFFEALEDLGPDD